MRTDRTGECSEGRFDRIFAALDAVEHGNVVIERGQPHRRRGVAFVGNVVGAARERVDCRDRTA